MVEDIKYKKELIEDICNDEYILIIGSDVILKEKKIGEKETTDVNKLILYNINTEKNSFNQLSVDEQEQINKQKIKEEELSSDLVRLLQTKAFRVIFTTAIDDSPEKIMKKIWKDNYKLVIFGKDDTSNGDWFKKLSKRQDYCSPTLFYIFGKAEKDNNKFVKNDNTAILFILDWMKEMFGDKRNPIADFIKNRNILALGCQFDDWFFRFFWYIITSGLPNQTVPNNFNMKDNGRVVFGMKTEELKDTSENAESQKRRMSKLDYFIENNNIIRQDDLSLFNFLDSMTKSLSKRDDKTIMELFPTNTEYDVIVSCCGIYDKNDAIKLSVKLKKQLGDKYRFWVNEYYHINNQYPDPISSIYNNSKILILVLTKEMADNLKSDNDSKKETQKQYIVNEVTQFNQLGEIKRIIPVAVDGYNLYDDYHTKVVEDVIGNSHGYNMEKLYDNNNNDWLNFLEDIKQNADNDYYSKVQKIDNQKEYGEIFLSYYNRNATIAMTIFDKLKKSGFKVWVDTKGLVGVNDYNEDIKAAIEKAKVFIILLTPETANHFRIKEYHYYQDEIRVAKNNGKLIIPLAVNGYQYAFEKGEMNYHQFVSDIIKEQDNNKINLKSDKDGVKKLIEKVRTQIR